jgi:hypothetical protein
MRITLGGIPFSAEALLLPARGKGHDRVLVVDDLIAVVDGSTPLHRGDVDAGAFASEIIAGLGAHVAEPDPAAWIRATLRSTSLSERRVLRVSEQPSATACAVRAVEGRGEAVVLGDCAVVVEAIDGATTAVEDRRINDYDAAAAHMFASALGAGQSEEEAWRTIMPLLLQNRDAANRSGTYWLLANDERAADELRCRSFDLGRARTILAYSDGFGRLVEPLGFASTPADLLARVLEIGLDDAGRRLRTLEEVPNSLVQHPRLQRSDDASAVLLRRAVAD